MKWQPCSHVWVDNRLFEVMGGGGSTGFDYVVMRCDQRQDQPVGQWQIKLAGQWVPVPERRTR